MEVDMIGSIGFPLAILSSAAGAGARVAKTGAGARVAEARAGVAEARAGAGVAEAGASTGAGVAEAGARVAEAGASGGKVSGISESKFAAMRLFSSLLTNSEKSEAVTCPGSTLHD